MNTKIENPEWPLRWKGEEIDTASSIKEARFLQAEYEMAYGGLVSIGTVREAKCT